MSFRGWILGRFFLGMIAHVGQPLRGGSHCQWLFTQMMADFLHLPCLSLFAIPLCKKVPASTVPPGKKGTFLNLHFPFFEGTQLRHLPAFKGLWRPIPASQGTFWRCLLAIKGLCELFQPSGASGSYAQIFPTQTTYKQEICIHEKKLTMIQKHKLLQNRETVPSPRHWMNKINSPYIDIRNQTLSGWDGFPWESLDISASYYQRTLTRRMVSWLIALSGHCSRVDNVLISVAILALTKMADISDPWSLWSAHGHSQPRQHNT